MCYTTSRQWLTSRNSGGGWEGGRAVEYCFSALDLKAIHIKELKVNERGVCSCTALILLGGEATQVKELI